MDASPFICLPLFSSMERISICLLYTSEPGDHITSVHKGNLIFFCQICHQNAIAFNARKHFIRMSAWGIRVSAVLADSAGLRREGQRFRTLLFHQRPDLSLSLIHIF